MIDQKSIILPQLDASPEVLKPFFSLENLLLEKQEAVHDWFEVQWKKTPAPLYGSIDLRNAGFKLAPIDMNLFPAGFNNLNPAFFLETAEATKEAILALVPRVRSIALVPENYTRNTAYWENVRVLSDLLNKAGFFVKVASISQDITKPTVINLENSQTLLLEPLVREGDKIHVGGQQPDLILLNNDLSSGVSPVLQNLQQPLLPPASLGWHQRLKSEHFQYYAMLSQEFADFLAIDPWLINPSFQQCEDIDFLHREGMEQLEEHTETLFEEIRRKYKEYGVSMKPFAVVKADAGTQGMAVMTVRSIKELRFLNRKQRTTMAKSKSGMPVHRVIIQEGVYTIETFGSSAHVAEPVVYLWGKQVVGGFYRIHQKKGADENLNSPGMQFNFLPFSWNFSSGQKDDSPYQQHLYTYSVIAQLSMLAAAREIKRI